MIPIISGIILLVAASYYDIRYKGLPISILAVGGITSIILTFCLGDTLSRLAGMIFGLFLFTLSFVIKGIGRADAVIIGEIGMIFGIYMCIEIVILSCFCMLISSILFVVLKKKCLKNEVPFIPYLTIGTIMVITMEKVM